MTPRTPKLAAADPAPAGPAAGGSAVPAADPAGTPQPPVGVPAQTSRPARAPRSPEPGGTQTSPQRRGRTAAGTPGPETARPGPAAVRARTQAPAGASGDVSPPAGSSDDARAAQRKAWKRAQSGHNATKRRGRFTRAAKQTGPGMVRRPAPESPGDVA
jgi:hypothetical protein